jgi:hypothetical protein
MFKLILNIEKKEFNPEFGYLIIFQENSRNLI